MSEAHGGYYLPQPSHWPLVGSVGLFFLLGGFAYFLHGGSSIGMLAGAAILIYMLFGWFGTVIRESEDGKYDDQVDMTFRWSMGWFIFSEVMFFAAFFGALFYVRTLSVPWLGGAGNNAVTSEWLWPGFEAMWPTNGPGNVGGEYRAMGAWGIPAVNTLILLSSGVTVTCDHDALGNAQAVVYLLDCRTGQYEFISNGCESLTGIPASEMTVRKFRALVQENVPIEEDAPADPVERGRAFRNGETKQYRADIRIITPNGEEKWLTDISVPVHDEDTGNITGSLGMIQDTTYRKRI